MRVSCRKAAAAMLCAVGFASCSGGTPPVNPPAASPSPASLLERISTDPFANAGSQHATEVEPSAAVSGSTIVAAFQTGRFASLGASDIGFATSLDGGTSWTAGALPATRYALPTAGYDRGSDPVVAYDARHAIWIIVAEGIDATSSASTVVVAHSADALTWSAPSPVSGANQTATDKPWITCDNHPFSRFYGNCYVEFDTYDASGRMWMSTSHDGGVTWSAPLSPSTWLAGIGGQPVVQPTGTVVVPIDGIEYDNIAAFQSTDGGASWDSPFSAGIIADHGENWMRAAPLVSAAVDGTGKIYVVWQDCSFRANCSANDLVFSTSSDGMSWTLPTRIPADPLTSTVDHFLPSVGIDPQTGGGSAHIGVTYYSYQDSSCGASDCRLFLDFIGSPDGGKTWSAPQVLASPMPLSWLANSYGAMVGDYAATIFPGGSPMTIAAVAAPPNGATFNEAVYASKPGSLSLTAGPARTSIGEHRVPGFHADHPPHRIRLEEQRVTAPSAAPSPRG